MGGGSIAQWIRLLLPSCHPVFTSQAHHLRFYPLQDWCYICHVKRTKINKKEAGFCPIFLKKEQNEIRTERHRPSYIFGKKRLCKNMKRFLSFQYPETLKRPSQVSKRYPKNTFFIKNMAHKVFYLMFQIPTKIGACLFVMDITSKTKFSSIRITPISSL